MKKDYQKKDSQDFWKYASDPKNRKEARNIMGKFYMFLAIIFLLIFIFKIDGKAQYPLSYLNDTTFKAEIFVGLCGNEWIHVKPSGEAAVDKVDYCRMIYNGRFKALTDIFYLYPEACSEAKGLVLKFNLKRCYPRFFTEDYAYKHDQLKIVFQALPSSLSGMDVYNQIPSVIDRRIAALGRFFVLPPRERKILYPSFYPNQSNH